MTNSADPVQLASVEASLSRSALFAKGRTYLGSVRPELVLFCIFFSSVAACIEELAAHATFLPTSPSTLHNFDVIVTFVCDVGYNHSTGDLIRTCQNDGTWSGTLPTCPSK